MARHPHTQPALGDEIRRLQAFAGFKPFLPVSWAMAEVKNMDPAGWRLTTRCRQGKDRLVRAQTRVRM